MGKFYVLFWNLWVSGLVNRVMMCKGNWKFNEIGFLCVMGEKYNFIVYFKLYVVTDGFIYFLFR